MALTESTMLELGTTAPDFALTDVVTGKTVRRDDFRGQEGPAGHVHLRPLPLCEAHREGPGRAGQGLRRQAYRHCRHQQQRRRHPSRRLAPPDSSSRRQHSASIFPYLYDETQAVARAYKAACTPDFFLFDAEITAWFIAANSTQAAPATASPSPAKTCAPLSTWCSPASRCPRTSVPPSAATSSGRRNVPGGASSLHSVCLSYFSAFSS